MKYFISFGLSCILFLSSNAQNTWSSNVAEIVYNNCSSCHNPLGIAPFSLLTYSDAKSAEASIKYAVSTEEMPPWIANTDYQTYAHERVLTATEKAAIIDWVNNGSPEGDSTQTPPPPVYSSKGFVNISPDLELKLPKYTSKASATSDDYVCFSIPSNLSTDKRIRAFEVIPGNHNIVHHSLVYIDESGNYATDTSGGVCVGPVSGLIGGYVPGSPPTIFPSNGTDFNLGFEIKAGSNVVLAMHYPEGSYGLTDSTIVRFWFYDDNLPVRELLTSSIIENWQFALPANQMTDVSSSTKIGATDYSVLSVFPHMHLLGHNIKSFAVTPANDTLPFVDIPHWDFEWQEFLFFKNIIRVPKRSTFYGFGTYDNTTNNPHNPQNPPVNVYPGLNTSDEMFLVYFHYMPYVAGDENRDIQALSTLSISDFSFSNLSVFPNPASTEVNFSFSNQNTSNINIRIYDMNGSLVADVATNKQLTSDKGTIKWIIPSDLANGNYFYSINLDGSMGSGSLIIQR